MLPGFRFLVAAIVFSLSLLVFGLGAAALFRAAHEQFASSSSWRTTPEGSYTSFLPPAEPPRPVIAMLRVEPPASAPVPTSEQHADLPSVDSSVEIPAASADTSDAAPTATAPAPVELPAAPEVTVAAAPPAPAPEPIVVAAAAPIATAANTGSTEAAKIDTATAVPPSPPPPAPEVVAADQPKPDSTTSPATPPAASSPSVTTETAVARQDALPVFAEAKVLTTTAIVTSDASSATLLPAPTPSRSELLAQMIALSADRPAATEQRASIKTASIHLHVSLARKRQAKERLARQRLAEAQRAKRQRALRARAARLAAAAQQRQQQQQQPFADPFTPPQGFRQPAAGQQALGQQVLGQQVLGQQVLGQQVSSQQASGQQTAQQRR
jgi:hypothetical protein